MKTLYTKQLNISAALFMATANIWGFLGSEEVVDNIILNAPLHVNVDWKSPWWVKPMGIEHERTHLETTSVLGVNFRLIKGPLEIPFTFRETRSRFQHTNMEVTLWEKTT